jgi:LysR family transcriptional regulator for bpeEF and oprC
MAVFVRVAEARSFTMAAARLGISPSATSKAVARLEQSLGVRLVVRTTRSVRLTEEGETLLATCRHVLAEIANTEALLSTKVAQPSGRLRLHSTVGFGRCIVVPLLCEFARRWPRLTLDVDLSDRDVNLHEEAFDATIRFGELPDSLLVARELGYMQFVTIASPAYLERHGEPQHPDDLARHTCLGYFQPRVSRYRDWEYTDGQSRVAPSAHFNINNAQALVDAVIDGQGVAHLPKVIAFDALREGRVHSVLAQFATRGWPVSLVYPQRRYQSQRVQTLVDFLFERIPADPRWRAEADVELDTGGARAKRIRGADGPGRLKDGSGLRAPRRAPRDRRGPDEH